jgi:hypothetical protein
MAAALSHVTFAVTMFEGILGMTWQSMMSAAAAGLMDGIVLKIVLPTWLGMTIPLVSACCWCFDKQL